MSRIIWRDDSENHTEIRLEHTDDGMILLTEYGERSRTFCPALKVSQMQDMMVAFQRYMNERNNAKTGEVVLK